MGGLARESGRASAAVGVAVVNTEQRLTRLERAKRRGPSPRGNPTLLEMYDASRRGLWNFSDWRVALGEDQIEKARREIMQYAVEAREDRERGLSPHLGHGVAVAGAIVSFLPSEDVPQYYPDLIDAALHKDYIPESLPYLVAAVVAAIVLDTRDGIALRRELWHRENPGIR